MGEKKRRKIIKMVKNQRERENGKEGFDSRRTERRQLLKTVRKKGNRHEKLKVKTQMLL